MSFILNQPIQSQQLIIRALIQTFKGISLKTAVLISAQLGFGKNAFINQLTKTQFENLNKFIKQFLLTNADLDQFNFRAIHKLKKFNTYRGFRHRKNLPVHGQRTRSNAQTKRFKKK